nr:MAG TPA: hypothetical protein [Caudoviricetes sp.]
MYIRILASMEVLLNLGMKNTVSIVQRILKAMLCILSKRMPLLIQRPIQ